MKVTLAELLMNRHHEYPPTATMLDNASKLLVGVNMVRDAYNKAMVTSSGYRPGKYNQLKNAAKASLHKELAAWDFEDPDRSLAKFCLANLALLAKAGLWLEDPASTPGWVHLDIKPRANRVFKP